MAKKIRYSLEEVSFLHELNKIHPSLKRWASAQMRDDGRSMQQVKERLAEIIEKEGRR